VYIRWKIVCKKSNAFKFSVFIKKKKKVGVHFLCVIVHFTIHEVMEEDF